MAISRFARGRSLVVGAAAVSLLLAACSGGTTNQSPTPTDQPGTGGATEKTDAPDKTDAPGGEKVTLDYIHRLPDGAGMTLVKDIVQKWNDENPNIQVTATKWDGQAQELQTKLETDVKAGNAACLAQVGYSEVPGLFVKGMFEDVTQYANEFKGNYSEGTFGMMTVGDKVVGLPQDTGPLVYYYNKAAFEQHGLKVPTTMDEFVTTAKEAAAKGVYIADFTPDETAMWMSGQAAAAGASWYSVDGDQWVVNTTSDETKKVAAVWQDLLDSNAVLKELRWDDGFGNALLEGKLIGHIGAAWEAPLLADTMKDADSAGNWQVAQLPTWDGTARSGPDGGSGVGIMKGCAHPAEAVQFANWFNTQIDDLVSQGLVVAATTGQMKTPEALSTFYGGQDVFAELTKANETMNANFPYIPGFSSVMDPMTQAGSAAADGSGKVEAIFETAQSASVTALKDLGLPVKE